MLSPDLYDEYVNGQCAKVWTEISTLAYDDLNEEERSLVHSIIGEALTRIDQNAQMVYEVYERYGFTYENYGDLNTSGEPYELFELEEYQDRMMDYFQPGAELRLPLLYASFHNLIKVIDFRGSFKSIETEMLLDALFIESASPEDVRELTYDVEDKETQVSGFMFAPDAEGKEGEGDGTGPFLVMHEKIYIDNQVVNFSEQFHSNFMEYLRFCFAWACMPNLYWASAADREPFLPLIEEVRAALQPF